MTDSGYRSTVLIGIFRLSSVSNSARFDERGGDKALPEHAVQQATARAFEAMATVRPDLAREV